MAEVRFKLLVVGGGLDGVFAYVVKKKQMYVTIVFLSLKLLENNLTLIYR